MKVFISWSGERSKAVGELLNEWLQCVIQAINPWMSNKDIDKGSLWFSEISNNLQNICIGIICLTSENINKPWILFEAGALAKGLSNNRVCTFLVDLEPEDITDPLARFNHTIPTKEDMRGLVKTLNNYLNINALNDKVLENAFTTYWPQFEEKFKYILENTENATASIERDDDDILKELLAISRSLDKRMRKLEFESPNSYISSYNDYPLNNSTNSQKRKLELYFIKKRLRESNFENKEDMIKKISEIVRRNNISLTLRELEEICNSPDIVNRTPGTIQEIAN